MNKIRLKHLWLETTNRCNGNCVFCGRQWAPPPQDMDFDLFKSIVDQCPEAEVVQTQGFGEPLLYPHIVEAIEYAASKGKRTVFYTNGSLLDDELSRRLLKAGLWRIIFSVDDMNREGYEAARRGLSWDTLTSNIARFQSMRNRGRYHTETIVRMCVTPENRSRIAACEDFWRRRVDRVTKRVEVDIPGPAELRETPYVIGKPIMDCPFPYNYLSVKSSGDVVVCCRDWFSVYVAGNLHEGSVRDIYHNGDAFNRFRRAHKTGVDLPYLCHICKTDREPQRHGKG